MKKYNVVIFGGAGDMGRALVFYMAHLNATENITVFDPNWDRLNKATTLLTKLLGGHAKKITYALELTAIDWKNVHVIISCAPHKENLEITRLALKHGISYCDLGGCPDVVAEQEKLARGAKSPIVPDCGLSPGLINIVAVHFVKEFGYTDIRMRCGCNPHPRPNPQKNPLMYKLVYSPEGTASGYCGMTTAIRNGELVSIPSVATIECFDEEFESAPTSHHSHFFAEYLLSLGVKNCDYHTLRYYGHFEKLIDDGWRHDSDSGALAKYLRSKPKLMFDRAKDRDRATVVVDGVQMKTRKTLFRQDVFFSEETGFTAIEQMTALGIMLVAHHMAISIGSPQGFATPAEFIDTKWYMNEIDTWFKSFVYKNEPRT